MNNAQEISDDDLLYRIEGVKTEEDCDRLAEVTYVHTLPRG